MPQGRLGNLIFQYQASIHLVTLNSFAITINSDFSDVFEVADSVKIIRTPKILRATLTKFWVIFLKWGIKKHIFGSISPKKKNVKSFEIEDTEINWHLGFFSKIWVIHGFFQHDNFIYSPPQIKNSLIKSAQYILDSYAKKSKVAVHFRFGDYSDWDVFGKKGASLPLSYYKKAFCTISSYIKTPLFIVFTDDMDMAKKFIGKEFDVVFFDSKSIGIDIAAMSLCDHAIISASTFAWWGAYLIKNPNRKILAPNYWAGFKSKEWFPSDIYTQIFEYIDVEFD